MPLTRLHRKVWLWWSDWMAIQFYVNAYVSIGIHLDLSRPYLDLHLGWLIVSLGRQPWRTAELDRHRHTCRGFVFGDEPWL